MMLSILICSLVQRKHLYEMLIWNLKGQVRILSKGISCISESYKSYEVDGCLIMKYAFNKVEIISAIDDRKITTGKKRNILIEQAIGKYVVFHDDDDIPADFYVEEILKGCIHKVDAMAMTGIMTTDGANPERWEISKDNQYITIVKDGKNVYLRYQNHISPIKREIASKFEFPDITHGEDYAWATAIHNSGLIKTEYKIERHPMYIYDYRTNK